MVFGFTSLTDFIAQPALIARQTIFLTFSRYVIMDKEVNWDDKIHKFLRFLAVLGG